MSVASGDRRTPPQVDPANTTAHAATNTAGANSSTKTAANSSECTTFSPFHSFLFGTSHLTVVTDGIPPALAVAISQNQNLLLDARPRKDTTRRDAATAKARPHHQVDPAINKSPDTAAPATNGLSVASGDRRTPPQVDPANTAAHATTNTAGAANDPDEHSDHDRVYGITIVSRSLTSISPQRM